MTSAPSQPEQTAFDFLLPGSGTTVTAQWAAKSLGRSLHFIYQMSAEGKLEGFGPKDRDVVRKRYTRRSVIMLMAEQADFDPSDMAARLADVAATLSPAQWTQFLELAGKRRGLRGAPPAQGQDFK